MTSFGHNMIGASVGLVTYSIFDKASVLAVFVAFFAGLISHYLFDAVPHGHYKGVSFDNGISSREIRLFIIDAVFSLIAILTAVILYGSGAAAALVMAGIVGAQLPDINEALIGLEVTKPGKLLRKHEKFHNVFIHWHNQDDHGKVGRLWSWTDIWQFIPLFVLIWQISLL